MDNCSASSDIPAKAHNDGHNGMEIDMDRRDFLVASSLAAAASTVVATTAVAQNAAAPAPRVDNRDIDPRDNDMKPYSAGTAIKKLKIINFDELAEEAKSVIPAAGHDYIMGGSGSEWTLRENRAAFERIQIEPQYMKGAGKADMSLTILGSRLKMPIIIPPMGSHGLAHVSREGGTAKGAAAAGSLFVPSSQSNLSLEEIGAASGSGARWAHLYFPKSREYAREFGLTAKAAGFTAMVLTVDTIVSYPREANIRNAFRTPTSLGKGNAPKTIKDPHEARDAMNKKEDLSFDDLVWLKKEVGLPVFIKGVMSPRTAEEAVARGLDGVWVSNHGGRGLDGIPATIMQLPRIADAVKGRVPIILDSGVRHGPDVFRALALGATAVAMGRPNLFGLALGGWMGVQSVLEHIANELSLTMKLAGTPNLKSITREYLAPPFHS